MIASKVLICEGALGSIDAQILNVVRGAIPVQVVSAGSKYGMQAFVQGYTRGDRSIKVLAVRDRDFDYDPTVHPNLFEDTPQQFPGRQMIWARHELESYFLDPTIFSRTWRCLRSKGVLLTAFSDEDLASLLTQAARSIASYQAARWTLGLLKPDNRWPFVRTTWMERPGQLPVTRDETSCWTEINQMVGTYRHEATLKTDTEIQNDFQQFCRQFTDPTFYNTKDFLLWFSGKDLLSAFWEQQGISPGDARRQKFLETCPTVLGNMLPNEWPDDFQRLHEELQNL